MWGRCSVRCMATRAAEPRAAAGGGERRAEGRLGTHGAGRPPLYPAQVPQSGAFRRDGPSPRPPCARRCCGEAGPGRPGAWPARPLPRGRSLLLLSTEASCESIAALAEHLSAACAIPTPTLRGPENHVPRSRAFIPSCRFASIFCCSVTSHQTQWLEVMPTHHPSAL